MPGNVRIFVHTHHAGVAGRVVGQQAIMRAQLEDVQPIALETAQSRVLVVLAQGRIDCRDLAAILDARLGHGGGGKGHLDEVGVFRVAAMGVVAQGGLRWAGCRDAQRALIREVQYGREVDRAVLVHQAQQRRMAALGIEVQQQRRRLLRFRPLRNEAKFVVADLQTPARPRSAAVPWRRYSIHTRPPPVASALPCVTQ